MMESLKQSFGLKPSTPKPKVSVVIPCYNQGLFIEECLQSLEAQTFQDFEIIIINDGSDDDQTAAILDNVKDSTPLRMTIIHQQNKGLSATRNKAIAAAQAPWIITLDADDKLAPTYIEKTLALAKAKNLDFVGTDIQNFGEKSHVYRANINLYDQLYDNRLTCCALFSKRVFERVKYDETFKEGLEDWELWIQVLKAGFKGEIIHEPLFLYRRKKESMMTQGYLRRPQIIEKIRQKHYDLYAPEAEIQLKEAWKEDQVVNHSLHKLYHCIGLRSPHLAKWLGHIYLKLKN